MHSFFVSLLAGKSEHQKSVLTVEKMTANMWQRPGKDTRKTSMNLVTWYRPTSPIAEEIASLSGILVLSEKSSPYTLHAVHLSDDQTLPWPVVSSASPALRCYQCQCSLDVWSSGACCTGAEMKDFMFHPFHAAQNGRQSGR